MTSSTVRILTALLACAVSAACASAGRRTAGSAPHKSDLLPIVEIVAMDAGINLAGRKLDDPAAFARIESNVSSEGLEQLSTRGLIAGADYTAGGVAGIWGLYGHYAYFTPDLFRLSTTAFLVGTTLQASRSDAVVVQSSA